MGYVTHTLYDDAMILKYETKQSRWPYCRFEVEACLPALPLRDLQLYW